MLLTLFSLKKTVLQLALFCLASIFMKLITRANLKTPVHNYTGKGPNFPSPYHHTLISLWHFNYLWVRDMIKSWAAQSIYD